MTKEQAYEKATLECLSDPNGTRMDIIYRAMEIFAGASFASPAVSGHGVKWVKASERLPDSINCDIIFRTKEDKYFLVDIKWDTKLTANNEYFEWLDQSCVPDNNDFTFPFAKDKNGRWFYSYKDVNGLNQHSKSFDFYNHALEDYSKMRMVDESSTASGQAEGALNETRDCLSELIRSFSRASNKYPLLFDKFDFERLGKAKNCLSKYYKKYVDEIVRSESIPPEENTQDELFDELVTKLHNSYNEVELALLKTQYKIIRK